MSINYVSCFVKGGGGPVKFQRWLNCVKEISRCIFVFKKTKAFVFYFSLKLFMRQLKLKGYEFTKSIQKDVVCIQIEIEKNHFLTVFVSWQSNDLDKFQIVNLSDRPQHPPPLKYNYKHPLGCYWTDATGRFWVLWAVLFFPHNSAPLKSRHR